MRISRAWMAGYVVAVMLVTALVPRVTIAQQPSLESASAREQTVNTEDRSKWTVQGEDQAIAKAREILGLPDRPALPAVGALVTLAEDNTPFLSADIIGRPIWHVVIRNWKIELKSAPPDVTDSYARTFDIFVDPQNGRLLKTVSRWPDGVPPIPPEPGASSYTDQMRRSGDEKYHGFPQWKPVISFVDALDGIFKGGRNPLLAEQMVGQYVIWSHMGRTPKPVWVITLRGNRPLWESAYPGASPNARNHLRHIVDPKTGKWICASSTPQPQTTEETEIKEQTESNETRP